MLGQRHFDVQIMGGAALHFGNIAEMKTGEGKTLVATLPSYLNALAGKGVHVVTVNDYLAKLPRRVDGPDLPLPRPDGRHGPAADDVRGSAARPTPPTSPTAPTTSSASTTCATTWPAGIEDCVQRGHHFAIVDEVDSILIDEARTPLIISGPSDDEVKWYDEFAELVGRLRNDDRLRGRREEAHRRRCSRTASTRVEDHLGIDNLYDAVNTPLISFLNNAIKAKELFRNDRDYVVIEGEVLIVDEHTGRMLHGRRYNEGLHQAIEAKEGVEIREEYQTLATITLQNYFRLYDKLGGMTGTAMTEASEFDKIYGLGVVPIPTNRPMVRDDQPDLVYRTEEAKFAAIVDDIAERHAEGQPMLVGTVSVEKSEHAVRAAQAARHPAQGAERQAARARGADRRAGRPQGRGHGRHQHGRSRHRHHARRHRRVPRRRGAAPAGARPGRALRGVRGSLAGDARADQGPGRGRARRGQRRRRPRTSIGTERHESRRIDNQLRGRSGRQGDPGESRFYLSLEDDLMRLFKSDWVDWVLQTMKIPDDVPIENKRVTGAIASAQAQVESQNFEIRKNILKYDDVMSRQREVIYGERRQVLEGADLHEQIRGMIDDTVEGYVVGATEGFPEEWDLEHAVDRAQARCTRSRVTHQELEDEAGGLDDLTRDVPDRGASRRRAARRTTRARRRSAPRSCASSSAGCC